MKNYKDYLQTNIGYSDIASLTIRSCGIVAPLDFGSDGDYRAYVVDSDTEIPTTISWYRIWNTGSTYLTMPS